MVLSNCESLLSLVFTNIPSAKRRVSTPALRHVERHIERATSTAEARRSICTSHPSQFNYKPFLTTALAFATMTFFILKRVVACGRFVSAPILADFSIQAKAYIHLLVGSFLSEWTSGSGQAHSSCLLESHAPCCFFEVGLRSTQRCALIRFSHLRNIPSARSTWGNQSIIEHSAIYDKISLTINLIQHNFAPFAVYVVTWSSSHLHSPTRLQ